GRAAIEGQRGVGLRQVDMATDLHRAVAGVHDQDLDALRARVDLDITAAAKDFTRNHGVGWWRVARLVAAGDVACTWTPLGRSGPPSITSSRLSTPHPLAIRSATVRPSRAPSRMWSVITATASGWLRRRPRARRRRANSAA